MCDQCNVQPKVAGDPKDILDADKGVRLTYDITLPAELYNVPFAEYLEAVDRSLESQKRAIYKRAKESYIERGLSSVIKEINNG